ncbi:hypothetical protein BGZ80_007002 [Entomortierella chlamydospora]|uniref:Uncharacterized protein n=1 Tax=Entomortierella chlamydospora TaxID=101097 RepID=A0A9P6T1S6_9FUNG|nr:hypothetical protein BGZ79_000625 [Entomortierella chlamydospora]KAG0018588.1 hypothetical protein BGZ80_007002 [Entomortierella chlamydospora]
MPPATITESARRQAQGLSTNHNFDRTSYVSRSMLISPMPTYPNSRSTPNTSPTTNYSSSPTSFGVSSTAVSSLGPNTTKICGAVLGSMVALSLLCCICVFRRRLLNNQFVHSVQAQKHLDFESPGGTDMKRYETLDKARIVVVIGDIGTENKKGACFREDELPKRTSMRVGDKGPTSSVAPSSSLSLSSSSSVLWLFFKSTRIFKAIDGHKKHDVVPPTLEETSTRFDPSRYPGAAPGYSTFKSMPICVLTPPPTLQQKRSTSDVISNNRPKIVKDTKDVVNDSSNKKSSSAGENVKDIWERTGGLILKGRNEQRSKNHVSQYFKAQT